MNRQRSADQKTEPDAYEVCRYVRHYRSKNGCAPRIGELTVPREFADLLVTNGVVEVRPLFEGGPPVAVVLTEKGERMANGRSC